ncbi:MULTISPECIES: acyl-CoA dehydrogenase family protein [Acidiphilium]|jgi:acyl-CoA dehydrogenase|uniref:Acyl-CoA dehydrogenase domain protein n=2 Tax=Acidiphilium TaxID=522 RepID=A5G0D0_ACICJ|nr:MULTISPECIES: acyl-CoA dehydrogenase family protein [Acidiphilium]MBU6356152.1 acyl-CoA dehydrogenase family protein [Rhodospirillales bacterium]ABQ31312.1 acyl-CoA dehydrogenase domain protein [Acidiphilium cryptum JF-5]EGO93905.1 Acyl-CoA dehydrogenase domain-containing protein [Acidiphilium sp. PM]KDM67027.1 acyl-CoA dehydrogenase domain-containing protein [Acidiphilium sp. JA12-A1]MBS3024573.1 acyl-CoA dehydrogenase family protein [Acidiphilium multivorum]
MEFRYSAKTEALRQRVADFMAEHIYPNEQALFHTAHTQANQWKPLELLQEIKQKAKAAGLWNLFLPESEHGAGLTNVEYAPLAEIMGRSPFGPEAFNCSAPDTGNMEVLTRYGTPEQKEAWLKPLLAGEIRSAFAMTEPRVASSDAKNIETSIRREGDEYVIDGHKWWTSGAPDPRCRILIVMGQSDPENPDPYKRQSMILVPFPHPGVTMKRALPVFGDVDAPHGHAEMIFDKVRVPAANMLLGEGRGFEIAQGRLGPGRIHHCMRSIGVAERALERMVRRLESRTAFGKPVIEQSVWRERIAESRIMIDQARLLTLKAAHMMDTVGNKEARAEIAMIKVVAPNVACKVVDWAIQAFGGGGVADTWLSSAYAHQRTLRLADGPDEVHRDQLARLEHRRYRNTDPARTGGYPNVLIADGLSEPGQA